MILREKKLIFFKKSLQINNLDVKNDKAFDNFEAYGIRGIFRDDRVLDFQFKCIMKKWFKKTNPNSEKWELSLHFRHFLQILNNKTDSEVEKTLFSRIHL